MRVIRILYSCFLLALCFFCVSSCSSDDPIITVSTPDGVEFSRLGGNKTIEVHCEGAWSLNIETENGTKWIIGNITSGKGNQKVYLTAFTNTTPYSRKATLFFVSADDAKATASVTISQAGLEPTLDVSTESVSLSMFAGNLAEIKVESNIEWTVQSDQKWLMLSKTSGKETDMITISGEENEGSERYATITVSANNSPLTKEIKVVQKGMEWALCREPFTIWDASVSDIKAKMSGYNLLLDETPYLFYEGLYEEDGILYFFQSGKLAQAIVRFNPDATSATAISDNLKGYGYVPGIETLDGSSTFVSHDGQNYVTLEKLDNGYLNVRYKNNKQLAKQPFPKWYTKRENVKITLESKGYTLISESDLSSQEYYLIYASIFMEFATKYSFDSSQELVYYTLYFDPAATSVDDLRNYIRSEFSYTYFGDTVDRNGYLFKSQDGQTVAAVRHPSNGIDYITLIFLSEPYWRDINNSTRGSDQEDVLESLIRPIPSKNSKPESVASRVRKINNI